MKTRFSNSNNLWLMRLYYLTYYFGQGSISPFINIFYVKRGLSGTEIGILGTISALLGLLSAPFWGRLNDNTRHPRRILQVALFANSLAYYFLSQQTIFLFMALIVGLNALISSGVDPLTSAQALQIASESDAGFGSMRQWGSLGWALAAPISGWLIQKTSILSGFYTYIAFMLVSIVVLATIKATFKKPDELSRIPAEQKIPFGEVVKEVLKNRELLALILASVVMWIGTNGTKFESVYLEQLGAKESVIGWVNTVGAMVEVPMMLVADRVMRRKGSLFTLKVSFLTYMTGLLFIIIHPSVAMIFVYRVFGGVGLSFYIVSFTNFIVKRAPAKQSGTVLAFYSVTIAGTVNILVSPLSGYLFDLVGAYWLYVMAACGYLIAALIIYLMVDKKTAPNDSTKIGQQPTI